MKKGFIPPKGFNTRKHLLADAPYVRLLSQKLHAKIATDWAEKWQPLNLGSSLADCRGIRSYSAFISQLGDDILAVYNQQGHNEKIGISESSLKRLLDSKRLPSFLQVSIKKMLMAYIGYASWEEFQQKHSDEINSFPASEVVPSLPAQQVLLIAVSYTGSVRAYRFRNVNYTTATASG
ncbi:hypothetical protein [Rhodoflexus caldus]|uniref:hypothetical protein n=1 Tax=Rhodoflexus caldus TaxID=2891236 RepID=UPI002029E134|nr:hypothetical protein [Rhodoflexus caldus]